MSPRLKGKLKTSQYSGTVKTGKLILKNTLESKLMGSVFIHQVSILWIGEVICTLSKAVGVNNEHFHINEIKASM